MRACARARVCVCARACVRASLTKRDRQRQRQTETEKERTIEKERKLFFIFDCLGFTPTQPKKGRTTKEVKRGGTLHA